MAGLSGLGGSRKGRVKAVDDSGPLLVVTVGGQRMLSMETVAVDDLVVWLPGESPLCLGKPAES